MNTPVSFEIAKVLKEKGFDIPTIQFYTSGKKPYLTEAEDYMTERYAVSNWNDGIGSYPTKAEKVACSAPTIAEVMMWLYEKHGIWVQGAFPLNNGKWEWVVFFLKEPLEGSDGFKNRMSIVDETPYYNSPTEAYEAAITYTLNNLI